MEKRSLFFVLAICISFFLVQSFFGPPASIILPQSNQEKLIVQNKEIQRKEKQQLSQDEDFYVLENERQQLVFSTRGGALTEINLPFHSSQDSNSLVKELDFDRSLQKETPANAHFPLFPAKWINQEGQVTLRKGSLGGYYPLLRRSILTSDGSIRTNLDPQIYALNLVSEQDADLSSLVYRVTRFEKNLIRFEGDFQGTHITKTFVIPEQRNGPYCFELHLQFDGDTKGIWLSSGVPEVELVSGAFSPSLRYQISRGKSFDVENIELSDKNPSLTSLSSIPDWISNSNGYLGVILTPTEIVKPGFRAQKISPSEAPTRLSLIAAAHQPYPAEKYPGYATFLPLKNGIQKIRIFAGPFDDSLLKDLNALYENPENGTTPNYENAKSIQGWFSFISQPFSQFLSFLLNIFYSLTHSWGFSIIILTITLRLMMYPLNSWSIRSNLKMQELAPKVKAIQERYKKDPKKGQLEVMNLYREKGVNPFSGCLPILLQMPFLIGMFYLLKSSFPLRGASFIPGWIDNLAAPDVLFSWGYPIMFIGNEFHLLPILLGITTIWQQKMAAKSTKDGTKELTDIQKQQKMMGNILPIFLTFMFYGFPSGLNIYFISSTLLGILQQWILTKKMHSISTISIK